MSDSGGQLTASLHYLKDGVPQANPPRFVNDYALPRTGDRQMLMVFALLALSALAAGAAVLVGKRRGRS